MGGGLDPNPRYRHVVPRLGRASSARPWGTQEYRHPLLARTRSRYPHSLRTAGSQVSRNESGAPGCARNRPGASSLANKICLTTGGNIWLITGLRAVARSLLLVSAARRPRAPSPLRPRRDSRGEQLQLRDVAGRVPSLARRQHVPRLLAART